MKHLLDISALVALLAKDHEFHTQSQAWLEGKTVVVCPLAQLGFIRVAVASYNATIKEALELLSVFERLSQVEFVPADLSALQGEPFPSANKSTDWYLANLAQHHGMKWATFDTKAKHPAALVIPLKHPSGETPAR